MEKLNDIAIKIFADFPARFSKKEKTVFLEYAKQEFEAMGYETMEQRSLLGGRNLVAGPPDANILITAHYDTPGNNAWLSMPGSEKLGMAWAMILGFVIIIAIWAGAFAILPPGGPRLGLAFLILFVFWIKNKNNHNDNTSGVLGVFAAAELASQEVEGTRLGFVLFDNEEKGLLGSSAFAKWRKKKYPNAEEKVINLDCIGLGEELLVVAEKKHELWSKLADTMQAEGFDIQAKKSNILYMLSDHYGFREGVTLLFCRRASLTGGMYLPNIHSRKDTVCDLEKVHELSRAIVKFIGD